VDRSRDRRAAQWTRDVTIDGPKNGRNWLGWARDLRWAMYGRNWTVWARDLRWAMLVVSKESKDNTCPLSQEYRTSICAFVFAPGQSLVSFFRYIAAKT
jgi:hypothetical protein